MGCQAISEPEGESFGVGEDYPNEMRDEGLGPSLVRSQGSSIGTRKAHPNQGIYMSIFPAQGHLVSHTRQQPSHKRDLLGRKTLAGFASELEEREG